MNWSLWRELEIFLQTFHQEQSTTHVAKESIKQVTEETENIILPSA